LGRFSPVVVVVLLACNVGGLWRTHYEGVDSGVTFCPECAEREFG
jgi:hypothetical protein